MADIWSMVVCVLAYVDGGGLILYSVRRHNGVCRWRDGQPMFVRTDI